MIAMIGRKSEGAMTKIWKGFAVGLLIIMAALAPACRSTKKKTVAIVQIRVHAAATTV